MDLRNRQEEKPTGLQVWGVGRRGAGRGQGCLLLWVGSLSEGSACSEAGTLRGTTLEEGEFWLGRFGSQRLRELQEGLAARQLSVWVSAQERGRQAGGRSGSRKHRDQQQPVLQGGPE